VRPATPPGEQARDRGSGYLTRAASGSKQETGVRPPHVRPCGAPGERVRDSEGLGYLTRGA
jgi:hypothetical protein